MTKNILLIVSILTTVFLCLVLTVIGGVFFAQKAGLFSAPLSSPVVENVINRNMPYDAYDYEPYNPYGAYDSYYENDPYGAYDSYNSYPYKDDMLEPYSIEDLDFVWYEDDYVKFMYPEGWDIYVNSVEKGYSKQRIDNPNQIIFKNDRLCSFEIVDYVVYGGFDLEVGVYIDYENNKIKNDYSGYQNQEEPWESVEDIVKKDMVDKDGNYLFSVFYIEDNSVIDVETKSNIYLGREMQDYYYATSLIPWLELPYISRLVDGKVLESDNVWVNMNYIFSKDLENNGFPPIENEDDFETCMTVMGMFFKTAEKVDSEEVEMGSDTGDVEMMMGDTGDY